jgi:GT2 family glycosyltransferase
LDSTGDLYTSWGLPYPRGRDELDIGQYDEKSEVFSASGGASIYRADMLRQIGIFDEDFFAYYEDVDISFRAQLAGWKIVYQPKAEAYHQIGGTSSKIKDFTTYQTLKNLPLVYWKNVPFSVAAPMWPKIFIAYWSIFFSALIKGKIKASLKGALMCHVLMFKKLFIERPKIQKSKTISDEYIKNIITPGLPPNAHKLKRLRSFFVSES